MKSPKQFYYFKKLLAYYGNEKIYIPSVSLSAKIDSGWIVVLQTTRTHISTINSLSKFLRQSLLIFIIKDFRTIVFIFIVISTTFQPICHPVFFRCLSNSGTFTEPRTTSFIETTGVACSDSVSHNRVQELSIPVCVLLDNSEWIFGTYKEEH